MAKVLRPLHSESVSGKVGGLIYMPQPEGAVVRPYRATPWPNTPAQQRHNLSIHNPVWDWPPGDGPPPGHGQPPHWRDRKSLRPDPIHEPQMEIPEHWDYWKHWKQPYTRYPRKFPKGPTATTSPFNLWVSLNSHLFKAGLPMLAQFPATLPDPPAMSFNGTLLNACDRLLTPRTYHPEYSDWIFETATQTMLSTVALPDHRRAKHHSYYEITPEGFIFTIPDYGATYHYLRVLHKATGHVSLWFISWTIPFH